MDCHGVLRTPRDDKGKLGHHPAATNVAVVPAHTILAIMKSSPESAEQTRQRVLKISRFNGRCVAIVAGVCTLVALLFGDWVSAGVGLFVTAGGLLELRGHRQLGRGEVGGMRWLVRSQLWVLGVICAYAAVRVARFGEG